MAKRKIFKPVLISCACLAPVALVVGLSVNWNHTQYISSVGSSGVKPFIEAFGKNYSSAHNKYDVAVESGGTTFAIEQVGKGLTHIGNASNNPYDNFARNPKLRDNWDNKKTITIGWEGLVLLYRLPDGLGETDQENFDIVINKDNILDLYAIFSGYNETRVKGTDEVHKWTDGDTWESSEVKQKSSMYHYLSKFSLENLSAKALDIAKSTPIVPFVRTGGNTAANTSIAFSKYSKLIDFENDLTTNQKNAFNGGNYGQDRKYYESEEANARAWDIFDKTDVPGKMVYLTTGFAINKDNQKAMKEKGYKLAGYQDKYSETPVWLYQEGDIAKKLCESKGYNWFRPLNVMIDLNNDVAKHFVFYSMFGIDYGSSDEPTLAQFEQTYIQNHYLSESFDKIIVNNGAKPISLLQLETMFSQTDQQVDSKLSDLLFDPNASDFALESIESRNHIYGALDWYGQWKAGN